METFELKDRGNSTIFSYDFFDECIFGADKLHFRETMATMEKVAKYVVSDLGLTTKYLEDGTDPAAYGCGNPLEKDSKQGIAMNRWYNPDKKFWHYPFDGLGPLKDRDHKATYAVHFQIRCKMFNDFIYVDFGTPWSKVLNDDGSMKITSIGIDNLELLSCEMLSEDDANIVLTALKEKAKSLL